VTTSPEFANIVRVLRTSGGIGGGGAGAEPDIQLVRDGHELAGQFFPPPEGTTEVAVDAGGVPAVWLKAPGASDDHTLIYLHGGGYAAGSPNSHRGLMGHLSAATGWRVLGPNYRLAPEYPYPAALDDARAVYRWVLDQGVAPDHLAIAGDSAGGGLTAALLLATRDAGDPLPAAAALYSPWTDLAATGASLISRAEVDPMIAGARVSEGAALYLGDADPRTPYVSPLYGDLAGLPPLLILVGDFEVLLDDSVRFAERAEQAGVDVTLEIGPEMIHVWPFFAGAVPESDAAVARTAEFLTKHAAH